MPNYLSFSGRIGRRAWWLHSFIIAALSIGLLGILITLFDNGTNASKYTNIAITTFVWVGMQFCISAQRLHDTDKSAWWIMAFLTPYAGTGLMMYLCGLVAGTSGPNRFGPDPRTKQPSPPQWNDDPDDTAESQMLFRLDERLKSAGGSMANTVSGTLSTQMPQKADTPSRRPQPSVGTNVRPSFGRRV